MSQANTVLTPRAHSRLAKLIVQQGWGPATTAKSFTVSTVTARKWAASYRAGGQAGMVGPLEPTASSPSRTPEHLTRRIVQSR